MAQTVSAAQAAVDLLNGIRSRSGERITEGLSDDVIMDFCSRDSSLIHAIQDAADIHDSLLAEFGSDELMKVESDLVVNLQSDLINFYAPATVNPYVAIAGRGPWVVTSHGAVLHDNGGYGMLGGGHGPDGIMEAMSQNWVMANVMTPSFSH